MARNAFSPGLDPGNEAISLICHSGLEPESRSEPRNLNIELIFAEHIERCPTCIRRYNCPLLELADKYKIEITAFKDRKGKRKFYKTADAYKLWHNILPNLQRLTRYSLGEKISLLFFELIELILNAGFAAKENKVAIIKKASLKLDLLKFFLQIAWELKAIDNKKFIELAEPLVEIGRMLGGWQKQLLKETPPLLEE